MMRNILHILNRSSFLFTGTPHNLWPNKFFFIDYDAGAGYVFGKEKRCSTWKDNKLPGHPPTTQPILRLTNCIFGQSLELGNRFHRTFEIWSQLIVGLPTYGPSQKSTQEFIPRGFTLRRAGLSSFYKYQNQFFSVFYCTMPIQSMEIGQELDDDKYWFVFAHISYGFA